TSTGEAKRSTDFPSGANRPDFGCNREMNVMQATTSMPLPHRPVLHALAKSWWLLLLRGIAAIVFGVLAFAWPGLSLVTPVLLYGAFALVDGVLSLVAAFTSSAKPIPTWWLIVVGLLGIGAGVVTFL